MKSERRRDLIRRFLERLHVRLFILFLVLLDICLVISTLLMEYQTAERVLDIITLMISILFVVEITMRIYSFGLKLFFFNWIQLIDFTSISLHFLSSIAVVVNSETMTDYPPVLFIFLRLPRVINLIYLLARQINVGIHSVRRTVSENKQRYRGNGFDLDLCYITDRIVAMSFPSSGLTALYRNHISNVAQFFESMHENRVKIYNLCSEMSYHSFWFRPPAEIQRFQIDDHNVPPLSEMVRFVRDTQMWFDKGRCSHTDNNYELDNRTNQNCEETTDEDDGRIISVHCRGGKGRTGTMVCARLLYEGTCATAVQALQYFGNQRTDYNEGTKFQGVQTPSQSRYVEHFEQVLKMHDLIIPQVTVKLNYIQINGIVSLGKSDGSDLVLKIFKAVPNPHLRLKKPENCRKNCVSFECHNSSLPQFITRELLCLDLGAENYRENGVIELENNKLTINFHEKLQTLSYEDQISINELCINDQYFSLEGDVKFMFIPKKCTLKTYLSGRRIPRGYDNCAFYFWLHTAFLKAHTTVLLREDLDNPHNPKTWKTYKEDFKVLINVDFLSANSIY